MKASKSSDAQKAFILKHCDDGVPVAETCRKAGKRKLIDGMLVDWGISIRRACKVRRFDTSTYHYKSRRTGQAPLERRIKEICETRVRYGYRRVQIHLCRDG